MNKREKIDKLLSLMSPAEFEQELEQMGLQFNEDTFNAIGAMNPEAAEDLEGVSDVVNEGLLNQFRTIAPMIKKSTVDIYEALLDESDIDRLIEIYSDPVMTKLQEAQKTIAGRMLNIVQELMLKQIGPIDFS